ncbi:S-layer homology domain-containing protein [Bacillus thermotolerans]|uniref:SLH domain-containing protein n=1 Tax=Bacillus thermotolerans TaxID=1221996 RepID=A0A0F5I5Y5_BACTR|nr:S-layer homology domain-containing protein [Bacillus thermotolerans]KKB40961.1 hypothetical protein QY95_01024 [Bacillus thermotolerans]
MAYQPKSYRKFVATAATATLVATAVSPAAAAPTNAAAPFTDVSERYKEAVDYVVNNNLAVGITETQFGTQESIKRVDAAIMIARALDLDIANAPDSGFTDVPERGKKYVDALKEAGIVSGKTATTFGAADNITRGEMALILAKGYELTGEADHDFTDVSSRYAEAVEALVANGITQGKTATQYGTQDPIKRGEFAIFLYKVETLEAPTPEVTAVEATGPRTLEITGADLDHFGKENISVSDNTVEAISTNGDGTKAFVRVANNFVPGQETTVEITIDEETQEFTFTYEFAADSVAVENGTFDDDTPEQQVSLLINNQQVDYDYLAANGYDVEFQAFDEDGVNVTEEVFADNTTGELETGFDVTDGPLEYQVQATVTKGGTILVSENATIRIVNLDSAASSIDDQEFLNSKGFVQTSGTLVAGETVELEELTVALGSDKLKVESGFKQASSNPAAVSVNGDTLTAEAPGNATITITYGQLTKEVSFKVVAQERELAKVKPEISPVKLLTNGERAVKVQLTDQYGDPVPNTSELEGNITAPTKLIDTHSIQITDSKKGEAELTLNTTEEVGKGSVYFRNDDDEVLGTLAFETSKVVNTAKHVLEITDNSDSDDLTLNIDDEEDRSVVLELARYTSQNVRNGVVHTDDYKVRVTGNAVTTGKEGTELTVTAAEEGTADIAIYDNQDKFLTKVTVRVNDNSPRIAKVNWVNPGTVNYEDEIINYLDVLEVTESATSADVVKGITTSPATAGPVRITDDAVLFVDADADGTLDANEDELGTVYVKSSSDSNFTVAAGTLATAEEYTTAAGDEGTLIFTIVDQNKDGEDEIVASTSVTVDVPGTPAGNDTPQ